MTLVKISWLYIVIAICNLRLLLSKKPKLTFEIERLQSSGDIIPSDFIINSDGRWGKLPRCPNFDNCRTGSRRFSSDICKCVCTYQFSTFRMGVAARNSSCIKNQKLRSDEGCTILFENEGTMSQSITALTTSNNGTAKVVLPANSRCNISEPAMYWDYGLWKPFKKYIFSLYVPNIWNIYLQWNKTNKCSGTIVKQPMTCIFSGVPSLTSRHCILFKCSGKVSYNLNKPAKVSTTRSTRRSTIKTAKVTTPKVTTPKVTTPKVTTPKVTTPKTLNHSSTTKPPTTPKRLASTTTTVPQTTPNLTTAVQSTTLNTQTTYTTVETTVLTHHKVTTEKQSTNKELATTEKSKTRLSERPVTDEATTEQPTTQADVTPGGKGARRSSGESDSNTLMITGIAAVAAVVCVIIICIFLWFMMKRKRSDSRSNEACSTDMTVVTNGMNNASSAPTLKNPIYDNAAYCEPTGKHHPPYPKQLPMLGNPVYDKAEMINNNNNNKRPGNIKNLTHKTNNKNDSNHYDNKDDDEAYTNPVYQDLVTTKPATNNTIQNADYNQTTFDNTYAEPEKPAYEDLSKNDARDSIYQSLVPRHSKSAETMEAPEYLTLLDGNTRQDEQNVPEYLTLVGDENNQTLPATGEYDYAYVDGEENRNTLKAPKGSDMSQYLPPVYDVLEDPTDNGPPVYDVLEGPDSGDDYLVPADNIQSNC